MQLVAVPLFSRDMAVEAYMFRYLKENNLFSSAQAINIFDGASHSVALETLDLVGLEAFTLGNPLFIPINEIQLLGNLQLQCREPAEKIVFVLEAPLKQHELYLPILQNLCDLGYRFAVNYPYNFDQHDPVMDLCSYIFLSQRPERKDETERIFRDIKVKYPKLEPIATHIYTEEVLKSLYEKGYAMYESRFYRVPASKTHGTISPLKINAVRLINTVQDENFDFDNVSSVVQRDPALTISLLKIVNAHHMRSSNKIKTIPQAVAMMGQQEVRKWVTTAVSQSLGDDRPNEVTRMSLIRAKFAENLSPLFEMAHMSGELFLMGLFSVIDVILEVPMEEALNMVLVSDTIRNALLKGEGIFANVLKMVTDYENANWSAVSRHMIVHDIAEEALSKSYIDALVWYRNLIMQDEEELIAEVNSAEATAE